MHNNYFSDVKRRLIFCVLRRKSSEPAVLDFDKSSKFAQFYTRGNPAWPLRGELSFAWLERHSSPKVQQRVLSSRGFIILSTIRDLRTRTLKLKLVLTYLLLAAAAGSDHHDHLQSALSTSQSLKPLLL
jgi:hypothetical protein